MTNHKAFRFFLENAGGHVGHSAESAAALAIARAFGYYERPHYGHDD